MVDVHMSRLRAAVDRGFDRPLLHTVRGAGYVLRDGGLPSGFREVRPGARLRISSARLALPYAALVTVLTGTLLTTVYLLTRGALERGIAAVAGNLPAWPRDAGGAPISMVEFEITAEERGEQLHPVEARIARLSNGNRLLVGADSSERRNVLKRSWLATLWGTGLTARASGCRARPRWGHSADPVVSHRWRAG